MQFGVLTFVTDEGIGPAELGAALEHRGFESLFLAEHTHIPVNTQSPYPGGGPIPEKYYRTLDPFVALAAAAATTQSLVLGTGIALIPERDPIVTAKEVASLDLVSQGRFRFGVGVGWLREEVANHGVDPAVRGRVIDERLRAIIEIWTQEQAEFHGTYVDFDSDLLLAEAGDKALSSAVCGRGTGELPADSPAQCRVDRDQSITAAAVGSASAVARHGRGRRAGDRVPVG
ncbi:hypothetical protein MRGA327_18925 [Mycobacterium tuberculosis RGTB327]|nr:hypothetical protein MRGA327_18925 [Mycobacterium tuberculosis RGTB327]